ncbi:MAG: hybrid sensor histidine kinase/response regulator [Candidatus Rokuibacteriota bacterium]
MKLRSHLVLLVLGALLPVLIFSIIMVTLFARQERDAVKVHLRDASRVLSGDLDFELASSITTLEALSASEHLSPGNLAEFHRQMARVLPTQRHWATIILADPAGTPLLDLRVPFEVPLPPSPRLELVVEVAQSGRPAVSNLFTGQLIGRPLVGVAVPVVRQGRIGYVLAAPLDPAALSRTLQAQLAPARIGMIIDRNRNIVARTQPADQFVGRPVDPELRAGIGASPEGSLTVTLDGTPVYGAFSRSRVSGWTVVLAIPARGIDASLWRSIGMIVAGGLLLLLLGLALAAIVGRRIGDSIASLSASAAALGGDDIAPSGFTRPVREVRELSRTIEEAAALLRQRAQARERAEKQRDQVEADLRRANEAKDEFLAMLGHELRNPIGTISNAATVLEQVRTPDEQSRRLQAIIVRQTRHLARIIEDLLDVARVTSGRIVLQRRPVDLADLTARYFESLSQSGKVDRHDVSLLAEPAVVDGDPARLEQVVSNLLGNAVKYTPPGGRIQLRVGREGAEAVLRVQDTGVGIDPAMLPRIFELFTQGERSLDRAEGGLGLGLTLVRRLVDLHGGTVEAFSAGLRHGSEFVVRLPLSTATAEALVAKAKTAAPPARRILLVEDNQDAREALRVLLTLRGHQVQEAADGRSGIALALAESPEVALIDIGLPEADGYEVARQVRAAPAGERIFLVALTGYGQPDDRRRTRAAGFDAHLVKPVDPDELGRVLARAARDPAGVSGVP